MFMAGLISMTNRDMGFSLCDENGLWAQRCSHELYFYGGFSIPRRPTFGVALGAKKVSQSWNFGLRMRRGGDLNCLLKAEASSRSPVGNLLEKELEFKPSFGEYLKAMESVRTGKVKGQTLSSKRYKSKIKENRNLVVDSEGNAGGQIDGQERGKLKGMKKMGFEEKGNSGNARSLVGDQLEGNKSKNDMGTYRELNRDSENGRWEKRKIKSVQESKRSGVLKGVEKIGFEEKANSGNAPSLIGDKFKGKQMKYDVGINRKWDMDSEDGRWVKRKDTSVPDSENGRWVKRKDTSVQESKRSGEFKRHGFQTDKGSLRGTKLQLERNYSQVGKRSGESVKFRKSNKTTVETSNDEKTGLERAAFKSFEGFNGVVNMQRVSRNEMEERIQKLARCLNGADIDMPEWMFSKMMRSAQIKFSDHSMLRIIQILGKLGNWRRVLQLIEWLQLRDRFKSYKIRNIQTTALAVLGKARRPVEALNFFHAMQQHMSTYPDLVAYHCIAVTLGQAGHMKELFDVIDSMRSPPEKNFKTGIIEKWDPRLEPDIVVYNAVLNACVQRKQWEGAFWVLQKLKEQHQRPSSTTYGLVMEVMFACGKYNLVHDFFNKVAKSSILNALTYKVMVSTLWKEGKTDEAVLAVESMERRGIIGSAALYYDLARCLCSAGRCQEALNQIDKICKVANKPLVVTYTGLIQACLDAGNIQNGAYIFNQMHKFCSPNLVTCNIMLKAYMEHAMFEEAKNLFQKMLEDANRVSNQADYKDRVVPDFYTFNTMLDACVRQQQWEDLEFVYKRMLRYGYPFNPKRHLRIIVEAFRVGKRELLETTWKHLARADQTPPPLLAKEMFCMKLEQGDHATAISSISSPNFSNLQVFSCNSWLNCFKENTHRFRKDSLVRLVGECSSVMSRSDSPNPILQNLVTSCREFLENHRMVSEMNSSTNFQTLL